MQDATYNEPDKTSSAWLENLERAGLIASGRVHRRSVEHLRGEDLTTSQVHLFAGIGVWSYALRLAGWPDDRPVWTGSCPCQPFSAAGKKEGVDDPRHLWPEFIRLIRECHPPTIFGEQVASKAGLAWLDTVQDDLEGEGYSFGAADLAAASVGAPHKRQRLFFVGHSNSFGARGNPREVPGAEGGCEGEREEARSLLDGAGPTGRNMADPLLQGREGERPPHTDGGGLPPRNRVVLADTNSQGRGEQPPSHPHEEGARRDEHGGRKLILPWGNPDWARCDDPSGPRWRPIEPGTCPMALGTPGRVGILRSYGNAIVAPLAAEFIQAFMETQ